MALTTRLTKAEKATGGLDPAGEVACRLESIEGQPTFTLEGLCYWTRETKPGFAETPRQIIAAAYMSGGLHGMKPCDHGDGHFRKACPYLLEAGLRAAVEMDRAIVRDGFEATRAAYLAVHAQRPGETACECVNRVQAHAEERFRAAQPLPLENPH